MVNRIAIALPCAALALLLLGACGGEHASYFPTEAGMRWEYAVQRTTTDGVQRFRYFVQNIQPGDSAYLVARESAGGNVLYYGEVDEGVALLARRRRGEAPRDEPFPRLELPLPAEPGRSVSTRLRTSVLENIGPPQETRYRIEVEVPVELTIESDDSTVQVPAGRFTRCLLVSGSGTVSANAGNYVGQTQVSVQMRRWYAPGVGLVRAELHESTTHSALSEGALVMELHSL